MKFKSCLLLILFFECFLEKSLDSSHRRISDFTKHKLFVYDPKRKMKRLVYYQQEGNIKKILHQ